MPVRGFDIPVLVRRPRLNLLARKSVMSQQRLVAIREVAPLREIVHGAAQPITAVPLRHAAQLPQSILQPFA